jgi:diguanylate cyclase (GGDEF)-like protein
VHLLLGASTLLVGLLTLLGGNASNSYSILYFVVAACAFCFLTRFAATAHAALIAVAYGAGLVLVAGPDGPDSDRLVVFALALAVGGALIGTLRDRHDQVVARLRAHSRADQVTGLLNARGFDELLVKEIERARRSHSQFAVTLVAIDGLTAHRARFGESEADEVLRVATRSVADAKRALDCGARLPEGLAILAPYTDQRGADTLADRIADTTRGPLEERGRLATSLGIAIYPRHGASGDALLAAARGALADAHRLDAGGALIASAPANSIEERMRGASAEVVTIAQ